MEILLLTLLGALTVGVGLWAASGDKKPTDGQPPAGAPGSDPFAGGDEAGAGPRSSPGLPGAGTAADAPDAGKAVVLGQPPAGQALEDLQKTLNRIPSPVTGKVVPGEEGQPPARQKSPGKQRPLQVTYSTDDLIARSSRHAYHRRALANAETLVERQKGEEALAIFERVQHRVPDDEINAKIQQNIEDIKRWLSGTDLEDEETIKFPEIIIPLTTQAIALENLSEGLRNISEGIVQQLASAFAGAPAAGSPGPASPGAPAAPGAPAPAGSPAPPGAAAPAPAGTVAPASSPASAPAGEYPGGAPEARGPAGPGTPASGGTTLTGPVTATGPVTVGTAPAGTVSAPAGPAGAPTAFGGTAPGRGMLPGAGPGAPIALASGPGGATVPAIGEITSVGGGEPGSELAYAEPETESAYPPGFEFDEHGNLLTDGWTDEDFDREWEKFKNLPLKDRRSGIERRQTADRRRTLDPRRRDRRSGEDRRKRDLFKEREDFLRKLARHKERKKQLEELRKKKEEEPKPKDRVPMHAQLAALKPETLKLEHAEPNLPRLDLPHSVPLDELDAPELPKLDLPTSEPLHEPEPEPEPEPEIEPEPEPEPEAEPEPEPEQKAAPEPEAPAAPEPEAAPPAVSEPAPAQPAAFTQTEIVGPELRSVGMPSADDPFIPESAQVGAGEGGGPPDTPEFGEGVEDAPEIPDLEETDENKPPPQEISGVLELKPPDQDDAPFLTLTYDFSKIPDSFKLSQDYHTMEYAYYKYKPMLIKAQQFTRRKMLKNALNYYRVIKSQNIPPEFKRMINRNINDITEYLEKFLMRRS